MFDRDWHRVSSPTADIDPHPPASLARMIEGAETLGAGFDFVRIDVYECGGLPRFGEMTFYPGSGLDPFDPPILDLVMGSLWLGTSPRESIHAPRFVRVEGRAHVLHGATPNAT